MGGGSALLLRVLGVRRLWRPTAPHRRHRSPPSPRPALRRHCRRRSFSARFLDHGALRGHAARPSSESSRRLTARLCWYQRKRCSLPRRSRCRWSLPQARRSRRPRCVSTRHQSLQSTQQRVLLFLLGAIIGVVVQEPNLNGDYLLSGVGKDAGKTVKNEKFPTHCEEHTLPPPSLSHRTQLTSNSHRQTRTTPAAWSTSTSTRL